MTHNAESDAHVHTVERDERTDVDGRWTESNRWHRQEQACTCGATRYRVTGEPWTPWTSATAPVDRSET